MFALLDSDSLIVVFQSVFDIHLLVDTLQRFLFHDILRVQFLGHLLHIKFFPLKEENVLKLPCIFAR